MFPLGCDSGLSKSENEDIGFEDGLYGEEVGDHDEDVCGIKTLDEYNLNEKDRTGICAAFTLLDKDGDGLLAQKDVEDLLVALGREPVQENVDEVMSFANDLCSEDEPSPGLSFTGFYNFLGKQLSDTSDESALREAFGVFGQINRLADPVKRGTIDLAEMRHYLKTMGLKLTDDEIDHLWMEEDYWMLKEKIICVDYLISVIMDADDCTDANSDEGMVLF